MKNTLNRCVALLLLPGLFLDPATASALATNQPAATLQMPSSLDTSLFQHQAVVEPLLNFFRNPFALRTSTRIIRLEENIPIEIPVALKRHSGAARLFDRVKRYEKIPIIGWGARVWMKLIVVRKGSQQDLDDYFLPIITAATRIWPDFPINLYEFIEALRMDIRRSWKRFLEDHHQESLVNGNWVLTNDGHLHHYDAFFKMIVDWLVNRAFILSTRYGPTHAKILLIEEIKKILQDHNSKHYINDKGIPVAMASGFDDPRLESILDQLVPLTTRFSTELAFVPVNEQIYIDDFGIEENEFTTTSMRVTMEIILLLIHQNHYSLKRIAFGRGDSETRVNKAFIRAISPIRDVSRQNLDENTLKFVELISTYLRAHKRRPDFSSWVSLRSWWIRNREELSITYWHAYPDEKGKYLLFAPVLHAFSVIHLGFDKASLPYDLAHAEALDIVITNLIPLVGALHRTLRKMNRRDYSSITDPKFIDTFKNNLKERLLNMGADYAKDILKSKSPDEFELFLQELLEYPESQKAIHQWELSEKKDTPSATWIWLRDWLSLNVYPGLSDKEYRLEKAWLFENGVSTAVAAFTSAYFLLTLYFTGHTPHHIPISQAIFTTYWVFFVAAHLLDGVDPFHSYPEKTVLAANLITALILTGFFGVLPVHWFGWSPWIMASSWLLSFPGHKWVNTLFEQKEEFRWPPSIEWLNGSTPDSKAPAGTTTLRSNEDVLSLIPDLSGLELTFAVSVRVVKNSSHLIQVQILKKGRFFETVIFYIPLATVDDEPNTVYIGHAKPQHPLIRILRRMHMWPQPSLPSQKVNQDWFEKSLTSWAFQHGFNYAVMSEVYPTSIPFLQRVGFEAYPHKRWPNAWRKSLLSTGVRHDLPKSDWLSRIPGTFGSPVILRDRVNVWIHDIATGKLDNLTASLPISIPVFETHPLKDLVESIIHTFSDSQQRRIFENGKLKPGAAVQLNGIEVKALDKQSVIRGDWVTITIPIGENDDLNPTFLPSPQMNANYTIWWGGPTTAPSAGYVVPEVRWQTDYPGGLWAKKKSPEEQETFEFAREENTKEAVHERPESLKAASPDLDAVSKAMAEELERLDNALWIGFTEPKPKGIDFSRWAEKKKRWLATKLAQLKKIQVTLNIPLPKNRTPSSQWIKANNEKISVLRASIELLNNSSQINSSHKKIIQLLDQKVVIQLSLAERLLRADQIPLALPFLVAATSTLLIKRAEILELTGPPKTMRFKPLLRSDSEKVVLPERRHKRHVVGKVVTKRLEMTTAEYNDRLSAIRSRSHAFTNYPTDWNQIAHDLQQIQNLTTLLDAMPPREQLAGIDQSMSALEHRLGKGHSEGKVQAKIHLTAARVGLTEATETGLSKSLKNRITHLLDAAQVPLLARLKEIQRKKMGVRQQAIRLLYLFRKDVTWANDVYQLTSKTPSALGDQQEWLNNAHQLFESPDIGIQIVSPKELTTAREMIEKQQANTPEILRLETALKLTKVVQTQFSKAAVGMRNAASYLKTSDSALALALRMGAQRLMADETANQRKVEGLSFLKYAIEQVKSSKELTPGQIKINLKRLNSLQSVLEEIDVQARNQALREVYPPGAVPLSADSVIEELTGRLQMAWDKDPSQRSAVRRNLRAIRDILLRALSETSPSKQKSTLPTGGVNDGSVFLARYAVKPILAGTLAGIIISHLSDSTHLTLVAVMGNTLLTLLWQWHWWPFSGITKKSPHETAISKEWLQQAA